MKNEISRRDVLKLGGAALGSLALTAASTTEAAWAPTNPPPGLTERNMLFKSLKPFRIGESPMYLWGPSKSYVRNPWGGRPTSRLRRTRRLRRRNEGLCQDLPRDEPVAHGVA